MKKAKSSQLFLFGGCYSNFQATQQIKSIALDLGFKPEQIICTGDIVGYCAEPEKTVNLIKNWGIHVIAGNVEVSLREGEDDCGCNFDEGSRCDTLSRKWFPYAQQKLSSSSIDWMKTLPLFIKLEREGKRIHILHGGTDNTSEFIFASTSEKRKLDLLEQTNSDVIIGGHCGLPFAQKLIDHNNQDKYWINPGVIGMPANDGTPRVWYGIYDTDTNEVNLKAFEYDQNKASKLMISNKLPNEYAHTLITGIWDNCDILPEEETQQQGVKLSESYPIGTL